MHIRHGSGLSLERRRRFSTCALGAPSWGSSSSEAADTFGLLRKFLCLLISFSLRAHSIPLPIADHALTDCGRFRVM